MSPPRRVVDALGSPCPVPVRLLRRAVSRCAPGEEVELLADDPLVAVDVPAWCHASGNPLRSIAEDGGVWRAVVARGGQPAEAAAPGPPGAGSGPGSAPR